MESSSFASVPLMHKMAAEPLNSPQRRQITVLVVEDNPDDVALLQIAAHRVCPDICFLFVEGATEALDYLQREGGPLPDVVLIDVGLRAIDGFELVREVRDWPRLMGLKILMWSGGVAPDLLSQALAAGADFLFQKGASFDDLMAEVKQICDVARKAA